MSGAFICRFGVVEKDLAEQETEELEGEDKEVEEAGEEGDAPGRRACGAKNVLAAGQPELARLVISALHACSECVGILGGILKKKEEEERKNWEGKGRIEAGGWPKVENIESLGGHTRNVGSWLREFFAAFRLASLHITLASTHPSTCGWGLRVRVAVQSREFMSHESKHCDDKQLFGSDIIIRTREHYQQAQSH